MPRVNVEGVGVINFPDDMSFAEIQAAIERELAPNTRCPSPPLALAETRPDFQVPDADEMPAIADGPEPGASPGQPSSAFTVAESPRTETETMGSLVEHQIATSAYRFQDDTSGALVPVADPSLVAPAGPANEVDRGGPESDSRRQPGRYMAITAQILAGGFFPESHGDPSQVLEGSVSSDRAEETAYLEQRLQQQIDWYDRKSRSCQFWFKWLRTTELIAAATIPLLSGYVDQHAFTALVVGALGFLVTLSAGLLNLNQYQERWVGYRSTAESLRGEKFQFLTRAGPYAVEQPFPILVQRVETQLATESKVWNGYAKSAGKTNAA